MLFAAGAFRSLELCRKWVFVESILALVVVDFANKDVVGCVNVLGADCGGSIRVVFALGAPKDAMPHGSELSFWVAPRADPGPDTPRDVSDVNSVAGFAIDVSSSAVCDFADQT